MKIKQSSIGMLGPRRLIGRVSKQKVKRRQGGKEVERKESKGGRRNGMNVDAARRKERVKIRSGERQSRRRLICMHAGQSDVFPNGGRWQSLKRVRLSAASRDSS